MKSVYTLSALFAVMLLAIAADRIPINTGTLPNDGTGDSLRATQMKANSNNVELFKRTVNLSTNVSNKQNHDTNLDAVALGGGNAAGFQFDGSTARHSGRLVLAGGIEVDDGSDDPNELNGPTIVNGRLGVTGLMYGTNAVNGPINVFALGDLAYTGATIQRALDHAKRSGNTEVVIPTGTYLLSEALHVWTGVSMKGYGWPTLVRNYHLVGNCASGEYTGERFMVYLHGANTLEGFNINGNSTNFVVATNGVGSCEESLFMDTAGHVIQTEYGDVAICAGPYDYTPDGYVSLTEPSELSGQPGQAPITIRGNRFYNSPGSAIKNHEGGTRGVTVTDNDIYQYLDHAVYFTGWTSLFDTNTPAMDVRIVNNRISYPDAYRGNGAIKLRNYASRVLISQNLLNVPFDTAFEVDSGDTSYGSGPMNEVLITGNTGEARRFLSINSDAPSKQYNLKCSGNNMAVADYVLHGPNGLQSPAGTIVFSGNTIRGTDSSHSLLSFIRGDSTSTNGATWEIVGNHFYGPVNHYIYGWVKSLNFSRNELFNPLAAAANFAIAPALGANGIPSGTNVWLIEGNHLQNYTTLFFDSEQYTTNSGTYGLDSAAIVIKNNIMEGTSGLNLADIRGTNAIAAHSGPNSLTLENNIGNVIPIDVPWTHVTEFHLSPETLNMRNGGTIFGGTNYLGAPITSHSATASNAQPAIVINNPHGFGTNQNTAAASIWGTRHRNIDSAASTNLVAALDMGNERETSSGYGYIGARVADETGTMVEKARIATAGARWYNLYATNQTAGINTEHPEGYGAVFAITSSTNGVTPLALNSGSASIWLVGQNVGVRGDDDTFGLLSTIYGPAHSYEPVLHIGTNGVVRINEALSVGSTNQWKFKTVTEGESTNAVITINGKDYTLDLH